MALRQLILARKIAAKRSELEQAQARKDELDQKREAVKAKEAELEQAYNELTEDADEETRSEMEKAAEEFESDVRDLETEQTEADQAVVDLRAEIDGMEGELNELNKKAEGEPKPEESPAPDPVDFDHEERTVKTKMNVRTMFGSAQQRDALFARDDVKQFAQRLRDMGKEKRTVTGGDLLIPEIMLPMIREQVEANSQMIKYVNLQTVKGTARETIMGTIPEAVWTEMCANLNELTLVFNDVEVDGYKVGVFIPVCNALLEDNDVNLVSQILFALSRAIAIALDKAILYGTGTKMPLGIVTRLAQTAAPASYPSTARTWVDLHTSNVKSITAANSTGIKLFQNLTDAFGAAKKKYGAGGKFWAMNEATHMKLVAEAMSFNANGAIVTGVNGTMPVLGGDIVELDFIPNNVIIAGYGELYLLVERAGVQLASSEHFMFTADKTVFKGTARYDGTPVIAEGFVAIGIAGATVAANAVTFTADTANT